MDFKGFGENVLTFKCDKSTGVGSTVKMTSSGTVTLAADGDIFAGVCLNIRDGYAAVQLCGYCEMTYTGTAPAVGYTKLASAGSDGVKTSTTGREYLVIGVDTDNKTAGFIL